MLEVVSDLSQVRTRAQKLLDQVIQPSVFSDHHALNVEVFQCAEPIRYDQAIKQTYTPVKLGFEWGPVWSTAWFRLKGTVPSQWASQSWRLLFDTDTEALCWWEGSPYQGVEFHRQDVKLPESVKPGQELTVYIEAACNHMFGVLSHFASPEYAGTFATRESGKLKQAHVALFHADRRSLAVEFELLLQLATTLPTETPRSRQVRDALRQACDALQPHDIDASIDEVRRILRAALSVPNGGVSNTAHCVGHAHIDLGWLWPTRETRRKCSRTFSTVLRNMERHPNYRFLQSQAQAYDWVRQDYPGLFAQIKAAIARGQWEAGGAMWVEADTNLSSGEALVRQILVGTRFWAEHFNVKQRFLFLPDVFGYSAALPQILKLAGLDAFITQKISWNQFNKFPHHSFHWVGIDGTSILAHFMPADNYNALNTPMEFLRADTQYKQSPQCPHWLQSFGYGDGGGGPTEQMIQRAELMADCQGIARAKLTRADAFVDVLMQHQQNLPQWIGELYLELHRGTYTTQARNKRFNRQCERLLQDIETAIVASAAPAPAADRIELDRLWKLLLLNQFHDIIPGSSIEWVYKDSLREYAEIVASGATLLLAASKRASGAPVKAVVLNTLSQPARRLVELPKDHGLPGGALPTQNTRDIEGIDRTIALTAELPGPGVFALDRAEPAGAVTVSGLTLENDLLRVELDKAGRVVSLIDKRLAREGIKPHEPANQLVLYEDRPMNYDAWDVDLYYRQQGSPITSDATVRIVEQGPVRVAIEFTRKIGQASSLTQRIELVAGSPVLSFDTLVDWREEHRLLRVLHPVDVHADHATYEIQFGHVRRPNHFNTSWDYARFEVCAQRWMDLSEPGFGVALLNDCKYGHSCLGNVMGMSLLRSPTFPDPTADRAVHRFTYALMPHGLFDAALLTTVAADMNQPGRVLTNVAATGPLLALRGEHRDAVVIETVKPAEDGDGIVVRLWESLGGRGTVGVMFNRPVRSVQETDLLERPLAPARADGPVVSLSFTPFQIRTIKVKF